MFGGQRKETLRRFWICLKGGFWNVEPLINHRIPFDDAPRAYSILAEEKNTLGIILNYEMRRGSAPTRTFSLKKNVPLLFQRLNCLVLDSLRRKLCIQNANSCLQKSRSKITYHFLQWGTNASIHGRRNDFENATSDTERLLENSKINTVAIATRHTLCKICCSGS